MRILVEKQEDLWRDGIRSQDKDSEVLSEVGFA